MDVAIPSSSNAAMAIDGLHASLIYVDELNPSTPRALNTELQGMVRWEAILDFRIEIERYWESLINITRTQDLPSLETLFTSFSTPTYLYEAAVFTFRNILTGSEPDSLENIFALCSLSYVASICSRRTGKPDIDNIFRDINIWRDSIGDPQHRQLFNDLIQRLWGDMTASSFQTEQFLDSASPFNDQDYMALQSATMHDISLFSDFSDPFWGGLFDVPGPLPGPIFQMTGTTPGRHPTVLDTPELQLLAGDLRQSAVMNILINFLANCGDLMDILSGHGATTKGPHSDVSLEVKNFTQALRRHDSFEEVSARGILAIVDRFVDLGYFQSIDEVRDYIIIVAKEVLPSGKPFAKVCKSVYSSTGMAKILSVEQRQLVDRPGDPKL
ncbi:hypothetical protein NW756_009630 [Fusarium oxysporum]|nr:hypothetical protein NW763_012729 [Fusarium oxysporum]KAJ4045166.1 hypothetical protein NW753_009810 [Fusarium oxysporum]KAJ4083429.1 hypothetical protein NW756_009630 [Fusarium oxysporum]